MDVDENVVDVIETGTVSTNHPITTDHQRTLPPPPQPRSKKQLPPLILIDDNAFEEITRFADRGPRSKRASSRAKERAVEKIIATVLDPTLSGKQQVLALRHAASHRRLASHFASAGLIPHNHHIMAYVLSNIKTVIELARQTNNWRGRTSDDMRSLVQTIVLATLPPSNVRSKFDSMEVSSALGIPLTSYKRIARAMKEKRAMLEGPLTLRKSTVFSQVVKSKGWKKITPIIKKDVHNFVRRHPNIVTSP